VNQGLLLDTHIVLWLDSGDKRLRRSTQALIDEAWQRGETIYVSAVSVWEIALLVDMERIELDLPVDAWMERFLRRPGLAAVALEHSPAARSYALHRLEHRDPADRLLIATAIDLDCPMVTYDDRMRRFAARYGARYRFAVRL